jgi:hypothetical protein
MGQRVSLPNLNDFVCPENDNISMVDKGVSKEDYP